MRGTERNYENFRRVFRLFSLTSFSIGISRTVRWSVGIVDGIMGGESGLSIIVTRGLIGLGLKGEFGDFILTGSGDIGISMIGLGVLRGGTE